MTVIFDLAIALVAGVIVSALVFAWEHAKQIRAPSYMDEKGWKVYELEGTLFFASVAGLQPLFSPKEDPEDVGIELRRARVADHSALQATGSLAARYRQAGKRLHLRHLSPDWLEALDNARDMIEVNVLEDPRYHIADNRLG